jgi:Tol biopolymer transport system component
MSSDARYVAFSSEATNLVSGDTNQVTDVFLRDRQSQTTKRISISSGGSQANQLSERPSVSNNGRYIAFHSWASNLVAGDTNERADIFVYDRVTAQIERMSVGPGGQQGIHGALNAIISGNGRFVVFHADINNFAPPGTQQGGIGLFVRDRQNGTTTLLNIGPNGGAAVEVGDISVSADGRYIAFVSSVPNLVPGDFNQLPDVFVYDRTLGQTTRISVATDGSEANGESFQPSITENGRYVVFASTASNFVAGEIGGDFATQDVFVHDRLNGTTRRVNPRTVLDEAWYSVYGQPSISDDGGKVVFLTTSKDVIQNDLNDVSDAVMIDRPVSVIRINTGGPGWTDSQGHFWEADRAYNTGSVSSFSNAIGNTSDDTLYQTERWDAETQPELQYHFAVANGTYLVRLHFAENVARNWSVGARVFDVDIEGINRFNDIDVFREAGARNALVKSTTVTVTDGELNILFRHQIQNPIIDAIEVIAQ